MCNNAQGRLILRSTLYDSQRPRCSDVTVTDERHRSVTASELETIEVGAADGDLRLWLSTELMRQGEMRLVGQMGNLQAAEARATSLLGWSIAGLSALAVLAADKLHWAIAILPAVLLFGCAIACLMALWPKKWHTAGYTADDIAAWKLDSELAIRESIASGYLTSAEENHHKMKRFSVSIRFAWICLALTPPLGFLGTLCFN